MKNKIILFILTFLCIFSLVSCGDAEVVNVKPVETPSVDISNKPSTEPSVKPSDSTPSGNDSTGTEDVEYTVTVTYNKQVMEMGELEAVWTNGHEMYKSKFDENNVASILNLDGEFDVYLTGVPEGSGRTVYTYNPNIYKTNIDNRNIEIELHKITNFGRTATGSGLYDAHEITKTGTYRATITSATDIEYIEYAPTEPGVYIIESMVNIYEDTVNPKIDYHAGTSQYKVETPETIDTGGYEAKNGYTKNFKYTVKLYQEMVSSVYTFGIKGVSKIDQYPINIDFTITYLTEYEYEGIVSTLMIPEDQRVYSSKTPDYDSNYLYYNTDGGYGNYYGTVTNSETGILDGADYVFNEEDQFWHYQTLDGPILCAKITKPCAYYEESLNLIESHGNKNLTVSNGTENYKEFIEIYYAAYCNSDGVCYVTPELKDFLQKFSVSQRLFRDGMGFVETCGVYAKEDDQWLFACGYYYPSNN
ncbi:MAG: hypothetical protein IJY14_03430 [Acholeplasmatales bacterium]|nr:hypothetical protein [Acholeplasmatales bacterium]